MSIIAGVAGRRLFGLGLAVGAIALTVKGVKALDKKLREMANKPKAEAAKNQGGETK
jgi:hypothetical protein